jgi:hypothetical protein
LPAALFFSVGSRARAQELISESFIRRFLQGIRVRRPQIVDEWGHTLRRRPALLFELRAGRLQGLSTGKRE